jgi:choline dehydrogenase-like flavoprotein
LCSASTKHRILASTIDVLTFLPLQSRLPSVTITSLIRTVTQDLLSKFASMNLLEIAQSDLLNGWLYKLSVPWLEIVMIPGLNPTGITKAPSAGNNYVVLSAVLQHPFSRGTVHITSSDPLVKPAVDPNYLSKPFGT